MTARSEIGNVAFELASSIMAAIGVIMANASNQRLLKM